MWLIDTSTYSLKEFQGENIPRYAILSHCWSAVEDEVSFKDLKRSSKTDTSGFKKIQNFCKIALQHEFTWAWVDTCCIDRRSSAELSEGINSMFSWYQNAITCFVFMEDVDARDWERSRWWQRGWTLQELIAPRDVNFHDRTWFKFGTKVGMAQGIQEITKIPVRILRQEQSHMCWTVAQRMSWAANRQTTRIEDRAYSLLGLFQINMPLLYGEGCRAFQRLQLELLQTYPDESVLAWSSRNKLPHHVLADSPDEFENCASLETHDAWRGASIDSDLRRINPPRVSSWGIELTINAFRLYPRSDLVVNGRSQKFLLAFTLTAVSNGTIRELPCTLVLVRTGPAPYSYQRWERLLLNSQRALCQLEQSFHIGEQVQECLVYLLFDDRA